MDTTQHELYVSFCNEHPNVKVGQTLFEKLKAILCKVKQSVWNMLLLSSYWVWSPLSGISKVYRRHIGFHAAPPSKRSEFISSILCDNIDDPTSKINCIKGLCETCGELALFPLKIENIDVIKKKLTAKVTSMSRMKKSWGKKQKGWNMLKRSCLF